MLPPAEGKGIPIGCVRGGEPFGTGPGAGAGAAGAGTAAGTGAPPGVDNADAGVNHCPPMLILFRRPISYFGITKKTRRADSRPRSRKRLQ